MMETQRQAQAPAGATATAPDTSALDDALAGGLAADALLSAVASGKDTRSLSGDDRRALLASLNRQLGLNPLSGAVMFLLTNGRETLYVTKQGTDQIARREKLTRETLKGPCVETMEGVKVVICRVCVKHPDGRAETCTATLPFSAGGLVNDLMKVETKAKRRATLSLCGLGMLAEDEIETIPGARTVPADVLAEPIVTAPPLMPAAPQPLALGPLGIERPQPHARREAPAEEPAAEQAPASDPARDSFVEAVDAIELPGEAVAVWLKHRDAILALSDDDQKSARKYLAARVAAVGKMTHKAAAQWCAKAIQEEDARRAAAEGQGGDHAVA